MIDDKIARVKKLISQREEIDAELATIFGIVQQQRRGRPRKDAAANGSESDTSTASTKGENSGVSFGENRTLISDE